MARISKGVKELDLFSQRGEMWGSGNELLGEINLRDIERVELSNVESAAIDTNPRGKDEKYYRFRVPAVCTIEKKEIECKASKINP